MVESKELKLLKSTSPEQGLSQIQVILLHLLRENGPMTRDQICEEFGLKKYKLEYIQYYPRRHVILEQYYKRSTIYDNLIKLQRWKMVKKFSSKNGQRGRPLVFWQLQGE